MCGTGRTRACRRACSPPCAWQGPPACQGPTGGRVPVTWTPTRWQSRLRAWAQPRAVLPARASLTPPAQAVIRIHRGLEFLARALRVLVLTAGLARRWAATVAGTGHQRGRSRAGQRRCRQQARPRGCRRPRISTSACTARRHGPWMGLWWVGRQLDSRLAGRELRTG